jgi:hypothetical protein
MIAFYQNFLL